jgi:hypothetical protein
MAEKKIETRPPRDDGELAVVESGGKLAVEPAARPPRDESELRAQSVAPKAGKESK